MDKNDVENLGNEMKQILSCETKTRSLQKIQTLQLAEKNRAFTHNNLSFGVVLTKLCVLT